MATSGAVKVGDVVTVTSRDSSFYGEVGQVEAVHEWSCTVRLVKIDLPMTFGLGEVRTLAPGEAMEVFGS